LDDKVSTTTSADCNTTGPNPMVLSQVARLDGDNPPSQRGIELARGSLFRH